MHINYLQCLYRRSCSALTSLMQYFQLKRLKACINQAHVLFGALKRVGGTLKSSL